MHFFKYFYIAQTITLHIHNDIYHIPCQFVESVKNGIERPWKYFDENILRYTYCFVLLTCQLHTDYTGRCTQYINF
jgi:hypothetical protein